MRNEFSIKLVVEREETQGDPDDLNQEELNYNRLINQLRNLRESKFTLMDNQGNN